MLHAIESTVVRKNKHIFSIYSVIAGDEFEEPSGQFPAPPSLRRTAVRRLHVTWQEPRMLSRLLSHALIYLLWLERPSGEWRLQHMVSHQAKNNSGLLTISPYLCCTNQDSPNLKWRLIANLQQWLWWLNLQYGDRL